jgi:hypothetical protein
VTTAAPTTSDAPSTTTATDSTKPPEAPPRVPKPPPGPPRFVVLENLEAQPQTLVLDAHTEQHSFLRRQHVTVTDHNPKTGEQSKRQERRRVPDSLTLWAKGTEGDKSRPLPAVVLQCADVRARLAAHRIRSRDVPAPGAAKPAPSASTTAGEEPKVESPAPDAQGSTPAASSTEPAPVNDPPAARGRGARKET